MARNQNSCSGYQNPDNYILVGGTYYKKVRKPTTDGEIVETLIRWDREQLNADFKSNQEAKKKIERFDGFCVVPEHINYRRRVSDFYNRYEDVKIIPSPGPWPSIENLLRHIFGEQYEEGLDYLQLLFTKPTQKLPILLLVSKERNTGKTTMLNFLKAIFKGNMTFVSNDDLRNRFNSDWAEKLIVAVDETLLDRKEDSEKIKALSTARVTKMESKGRDREEIGISAKIILCSNNVDEPVYMDKEEDRYWVREIPHIPFKDPLLLGKLSDEIPAFIAFLLDRHLKHDRPQERMWFRMKDLETQALRHIKHCCGPLGEIDLAETIIEIMDAYSLDEICLTKGDIIRQLSINGVRINNLHVILTRRWDGSVYHATDNLSYTLYQLSGGCPTSENGSAAKGRYYKFTRPFLSDIIDEKGNSHEDDLPL